MIAFVKGDLFASPAKVLVNTVNTVGIMGKGIAKTFKDIFPEMFNEYQRLCEGKEFGIGNLWLYKTPHKWVLNFPTKQHWRQPSKCEYVEAGLAKFVSIYSDLGITSVAFPKLGCGNGELNWEEVVKPLMMRYLIPLPINIFIYEYLAPISWPEHRRAEGMSSWLRSEPRTLGFAEVWADLRDVIGYGLTLRTWDDLSGFDVSVATKPVEGLRIRCGPKVVRGLIAVLRKCTPARWWPQVVGPGEIVIPQEAMLDLWQNIRAYGFCVPRMMSEGLDSLALYVMPLMARLDYMRPVELSSPSENECARAEKGLQLFPAPATHLEKPPRIAYAVQPV